DAFEKGNRPELAKKEAEEIAIIEAYMPKAVSEADVTAAVRASIAEMGSPTMKDMGTVIKNVMARFAGARVEGKLVSETVKKELAGK
ncbi:MAG TPA: GatB/YqeY domain-containing protein, partial [Terriglobales bacterium]